MAIFLVPSLVLLLALYLFPVLVNYISTGNIGRASVILVSADDNMLSFIETDSYAGTYSYKIWSSDEYFKSLEDGGAAKVTENGGIFVVFESVGEPKADSDNTFTDAVGSYFDELSAGSGSSESTARVSVISNSGILMSRTMALQFEEDVLPRYRDYLIRTAGSSIYEKGGGTPFLIDNLNPYTKLMEFRNQANTAGARVIPGILILLLYYCVYSLSGDILASDRERGFLSKLTLTPLSTRGLLWGKALAITGISALTSVVTLLVLILSSWANRSNNPLSLIPFGLLLTPAQLGLTMVSIICAALVMTMLCFKIIVDIPNMQDITLNLQLPLLLFLVDFFLQLFRGSRALPAEYFVPAHNNLLLIHDVFAGTAGILQASIVLTVDILTVLILYVYVKRSFEQESGKTLRRIKNRRRLP